MRLGSKDAREFKALAESFGWRFAGLTSNGHLRWRHPDHGEFVTSSTPTSWWWARKDLYAAMGQPVPVKSRGGRKSPLIAQGAVHHHHHYTPAPLPQPIPQPQPWRPNPFPWSTTSGTAGTVV